MFSFSVIMGLIALVAVTGASFGHDPVTTSTHLYVGPPSLNFGDVAVGSSLNLTAGLKAIGGAITVTRYSAVMVHSQSWA
jgi:hypothetical protein